MHGIALVPVNTRAAPIWVFCMPVGPGDPGSPPEVTPVDGPVVDLGEYE